MNVNTDNNNNNNNKDDALNKQKMENKRLKKAVKDLEEELSKLKANNNSNTTVVNKGNGSEACILS
jgi:ABC-type phosphate transport system auxiliary subunit